MEIWKLTDQEIKAVELGGGDVAGAQRAKRQAYLDNGGVILNPNALTDMYEALKFFMNQLEAWEKLHPDLKQWTQLAKETGSRALAKAEGK